MKNKTEWFIFKRCEHRGCSRWRFKWQVKRKPIWIKGLNDFVGINNGPKICGRCRKVVQVAINERNV